MKRIYIATAFLLITISLAVLETYYISKQTDSFINKIEEADNSMKENNTQKAYDTVVNVHKEWDENVRIFEMMLHNDNTDKISEEFASLAVYAEKGNNVQYFSSSESIKKQLTSLKESELLTLNNIL